MISQKWPVNCIDPRKNRIKDFAGVMFAKPFFINWYGSHGRTAKNKLAIRSTVLLTETGTAVGKEKTCDSKMKKERTIL